MFSAQSIGLYVGHLATQSMLELSAQVFAGQLVGTTHSLLTWFAKVFCKIGHLSTQRLVDKSAHVPEGQAVEATHNLVTF